MKGTMSPVSNAFEDLSHALRVLLEADMRANAGGLLQIDRAEAVGNIESALAGLLNAFHSLYDATNKDDSPNIEWQTTPELAIILALRNARHHNHAKKIRTLYTYYNQEARKVGEMEIFVFLDFPATEEGADTFDVFMSWDDLNAFLTMPTSITRIRPSNVQAIRQYMGAGEFRAYAKRYDQSEDRIFFNIVPLICNAAAILVPKIAHLIEPQSTESETYLWLFSDMPQSDILRPEVECGPVAFKP